MKCVCGYERTVDHYDKEKSVNPDGEKFLTLDAFILDPSKDDEIEVEFTSTEGRVWAAANKTTLRICPECGTVKVDDSWD